MILYLDSLAVSGIFSGIQHVGMVICSCSFHPLDNTAEVHQKEPLCINFAYASRNV